MNIELRRIFTNFQGGTLLCPRGARLGSFGCFTVNDHESYVIASEWMQTTAPDHFNWRRCMEYGSDNSIFVAKIIF